MPEIKLCECGCGQPAPISKENRKRNGYIKGQPVRFIKGHSSGVVSNSGYLPDSTWVDIRELYITQKLSTQEIAVIKKCSDSAVGKHLQKIGIILRSHKEQMELHWKNKPPKHKDKYIKDGYVFIYVPEHPYANARGYVPEHRLVVEKRLNRYLLPRPIEIVHHKGIKYPLGSLENRGDNRDENLFLTTEHNHKMIEEACQNCELKKEIKLLKWQMKQQNEQIRNLTARLFGIGDVNDER